MFVAIRQFGPIVIVGLLLAGCQSVVGALVLPKEGVRESEYRVQIDRDAVMTTSDGVRLVADVYRPET
ncbi:MAG: hypothetical protein ACREV8_12160, partial [Gammaproteobacteria bacterium]